MIRISQIKITPKEFYENKDAIIRKKVMKILRIPSERILDISIAKQSIDARKKPTIFYSLVLDIHIKNQDEVLKYCKNSNVSISPSVRYRFPTSGQQKMRQRPIIIGTGPAGLFCAYQLALHGYKPIVLERGQEVEKRFTSVEHFWKTGKLLPNSNVQFGEGGAGTFSDGKLNTLIKDKSGRSREVLDIFVKAGAPDRITYENKPHLGTDLLIEIVKNMRNAIIAHGGEVHFDSEVTDFKIENGMITGIVVNGVKTIKSNIVVLAIGHSARNTIETLYHAEIPMEAKSFAVGLRVEHPQTIINASQYDIENPEFLGAASYKLTAKSSNERGVYSFCMCPGGYVVNSSSEVGRLAINGMSYSKRDGINANSAIIVTVTPEDFENNNALSGIQFQRKLEENAFALGDGKIPVQYFNDFINNRPSFEDKKRNAPAMKGAYLFTNVRSILPEPLNESFIEGMQKFGKIIKGFDDDDTLISGIESRTSSPVRIHRDEEMQSAIRGLYPCGEGAGYAGGITSAAMDGIKIAEVIAKRFEPMIMEEDNYERIKERIKE